MPNALLSILVAIATISCAAAPAAKQTEVASAPPPAKSVEAKPPDPAPATPLAPAPGAAEREKKTRALVAEVARDRGLAETTPLEISFEDAGQFARSVAAALADDKTDPILEHAKWVAFGFAPPEDDPAEIEAKVLQEQVAAFYDPKSKKLHIPLEALDEANGSEQSAAMAEIALSHEIEHGLQDQHFPIPDLSHLPDDDTLLAIKSVYEGDATFVMIAVPLARRNAVDGARLLTIARQISGLPMAQLGAMSGHASPELEQAPSILRDELVLPYFGGMRLVAELYRAGGYPLVDQLFLHKPQSTEQVLHPEKYVAGEQPIPVDPPPLAEGLRELTRGRLGELDLRTLLATCLSGDDAKKAAEGWGGDAFLIAEKSDHQLVLEWSTAWDTSADARKFAAAIHHANQAGCFRSVKPAGASSWSLEAGAQLTLKGNLVSVVRGIPPAERPALFAKLLALPHPALPNAPPVGSVQLADRP